MRKVKRKKGGKKREEKNHGRCTELVTVSEQMKRMGLSMVGNSLSRGQGGGNGQVFKTDAVVNWLSQIFWTWAACRVHEQQLGSRACEKSLLNQWRRLHFLGGLIPPPKSQQVLEACLGNGLDNHRAKRTGSIVFVFEQQAGATPC
jgi:hypothetical protein